MTDREIVVNRLKRLIKAAHHDARDFVYVTVGTAGVIIRLLEEQERVRLFVDENGKITPLPVVVRCKDCRFWQSRVSRIIDGNTCQLCEITKGYRKSDWFCADGERRDIE